jgi:hypothetical protein
LAELSIDHASGFANSVSLGETTSCEESCEPPEIQLAPFSPISSTSACAGEQVTPAARQSADSAAILCI